MKKFLAAVTAASISFTTMASMGVFAYDSSRLDINGDGNINTIDALSVLKDVVGLNNQYHSKADIDLDGQVTSGDALYVLKHVVGISFDLPELSSSEDSTPTDDNDKVLVAYFSASGNTKNAAEYIANTTGADIFEIVPEIKYTNDDLDWTNKNSRVNAEHDDESLRNIALEKTTPDNWESYDTIFIGYPIWWGIAAWPVDNFVKENNFDGKTVIPFCTSASSGLGESGNLLKEMAGTGNWLDGKRFSGYVSQDEINTWLETINY